MIKNLILILLLLISNLLFAQEWTEPVNISNMEGTDYYPDITVSPDGTLHCVWVHFYDSYHREVFYSLSVDEGDNWSIPLSISNNDTLAVSSPHIVADSQNYLYVTYEYDSYSSPIVVMQKFDGENWSKIDSVAEGYSHKNQLFIDNNDRVYVFWLTNPNTYYKYLENSTWSEILCPYNDINTNLILDGAVDSENNLHLIGVYDKYVCYFKYDKSTEQMLTPFILTYHDAYEGLGITIDNQNYPHVVWHDYESLEHLTQYLNYHGAGWSTSELVAEEAYNQKITCLGDKVFIMNMEGDPNDRIVLYQQDNFGNWYGTKTLTTSGYDVLAKLDTLNNKLYNLLSWSKDGIQKDIFFRKTTHGVGINSIADINNIFILNQNFPNPLRNNTKIDYTLNETGYCTLDIYNLEGKIVNTLVNKKQSKGVYSVEWNGKNENGQKLPSGIYLYRLSLDNYQITKSLIIN